MVLSYKDLDKRILGDIFSSSEPIENLTVLCDEYGSRMPGYGDHSACDYMKSKFEEYGLENVRLEEVPLDGWIRGPAYLEVTSSPQKEIPCISLPYNGVGEVEGRLVDLGDGAPEVYNKHSEEIEGNIVMVNSRNLLKDVKMRMHRKVKFFYSVYHGAAGFIFKNHYPAYGPVTGGVQAIIPAIGLSYENGEYLSRLAKRKGDVTIRIETTDETKRMVSWNPVADLPGKGNDDEYVLIGSHYDGHDIAQGAIDPASGTVAIMEMARVLSNIRDELKRRVTFICFTMEELGGDGAVNYVERHKRELETLRMMMNFDAAGGPGGRKGFDLLGWEKLIPFFDRIRDETLADMPIYSIPSRSRVLGSDQKWFFMKGIPTTNMGDPEGTAKKGGRGYGHTIYDTLDKVELRDLWEASANGARAILRVSNEDDWPVKERRSLSKIKIILQKTGDIERLKLEKEVVEFMKKRGLKIQRKQEKLAQYYDLISSIE